MSVNYQPRIICVEAIVDLDLIGNGAFDRVCKILSSGCWKDGSCRSLMGCCHSKWEQITTVISRLEIMPRRINFFELGGEVHDEWSAIQYLQNVGLLHESRHCRRGHIMWLNERSRQSQRKLNTPRWRCHVRKCRSEVSVKKGTFFQDSNLPLRKVTLDNSIFDWT